MQKVVIVGARGSLARAFQDYLKEKAIVIPLYWDSFSISALHKVLFEQRPFALINCAGVTSNEKSFQDPYKAIETNVMGTLKHLELIRTVSPETKYVAFGSVYETEKESPYVSSKVCARELIECYRMCYGLWCSIITLSLTEYPNADSGRLAQKIIRGAAKIKKDLDNGTKHTPLEVYNIDDVYNFCYAGDVAERVWRILQEDKNVDDILEGEEISLRDFTQKVFASLGFKAKWYEGSWLGQQLIYEYIGEDNGTGYTTIYTLASGVKKVEKEIENESWGGYLEDFWKPKTSIEEMIKKLL